MPSIRFLGFPRASSRVLKFEMDSWKWVSEEFVRKSLIASPFMKPSFTPFYTWGWGGGVTRGTVGVLEGLSLFIVGFDVKDRFCFESRSLVNLFVIKSDFGV